MFRYRSIFLGLLLCLFLPLSGCVIFRVLAVKRQLNAVNQHFKLESRNGLSLIFLSPVLVEEDVLLVAKRSPTTVDRFGQTTRWRYLYRKELQSREDKSGYSDLPVDLFFKNDKLVAVRLPHRFVDVLPEPFVIEALRAVGRSEIHMRERSVTGSFYEKKAPRDVRIPKKNDFLNLLGRPSVVENSGDEIALIYNYRLKTNENDSSGQSSSVWAKLTFCVDFDTLLKAEVKLSIIRFSLDFR